MLHADLARAVSLWRLRLEEIDVNSELSKRIEFLMARVAENVPINLRFLCIFSVCAQMNLLSSWMTNRYILMPSTLTWPDTVTKWNLGVHLA